MKKIIFALMLAFSSLFASATIIHGTTQNITVDSDPEGAKVYVDGQLMGTTPTTLTLKKSKFKTITIRKKCYKPVTISLQKTFDPVALLNIFWDLSTTDFITGAISQYSPNHYYIKLEKIPNCDPNK
ncbi:PEGA domain-containing protein [Caminibacter pacificus]|nr:PEGA domain-containing protein [Campylobacterota bacterium]